MARIKVGITIGDPSGIGPIVTLKALSKLKGPADFLVIGDSWVLSRVACRRPLAAGVEFIDLRNVSRNKFEFGKVRPEYGKASIEYLDKALELLKNKVLDCLVTAPISKEAINKAGFRYSGHTEYLSQKTGSKSAVMMLLNNRLKFSLVTRHISLADVPQSLSSAYLKETIIMTDTALRELFNIKRPRIAVCGLNPHASDNGLLGIEEIKLIAPAISRLRKRSRINVSGPFAADTAIYKAFKKEADGIIAMYHDQALIPLKLTGADSGVNLTLGLPFIRTSPLHGTAFDIAHNPKAVNPVSMVWAIKTAIKCSLNQKKD